MSLVFGSSIEPVGMELDEQHEVECPVCSGKAIARNWEALEVGSLNAYSNLLCTVCNHFEGDTGEGDDYDHLFDDDLPADIQARNAWIQAEIERELEAQAADLASTSPAWLTKADFLAFAAGTRQAA